jgi:DNA-binding transcriptional regulator YiaG
MQKNNMENNKKRKSSVYKVPDYKKIYTDLITVKYPHLMEKCRFFLEKDYLMSYDVLKISSIITGKEDVEAVSFNARHKSYDPVTILKILDYQKKYKCSNLQLAAYFKVSRNTITKWKKIFL